ncbi:MAG: phage major capsid protein [Rhodobacteraceae bacterium]|nr:phage major capsid protein [Paracoccaceae bacterium]
MNEEELKAFIAKALKDQMGSTPDEYAELVKKLTAASDRALKEEGQESREVALASGVAGAWDPTDRRHPYVARAGHIIRGDTIRVQRMGPTGGVNGMGEGNAGYAAQGSGMRLARITRALRLAEMEATTIDAVLKEWDDEWMLKDLNQERETRAGSVQKAMGYSTLAAGGAMVPMAYMQEMIEILRARNVVRSAGATQLPIPRGTLTMNREASSGTSSYVGELASVNASQGTLEQIQLLARKLMSITAVSNELMRSADPSVDQYIRNSMLLGAANREDLAFIRGDGALGTPTGLRHSGSPGQISASASGTTLDTILSDLEDLFQDLSAANIAMERPAFFMNPRSYYAMMFSRDASGDGLLLRQEVSAGRIFGVPIFTTTQIPINLGGGSESELYLADMSQVIIGDALQPEVQVYDSAAYLNTGGVLTSAVSTDSTVIRMKQEHDIVLLHPEAVAIKTAVDF